MPSIFSAQDAEDFAKARLSGRKREALKVLHKVLAVEFMDHSFDRGAGMHNAPSPESGAPMWNVCLNGIYPEDMYGPKGTRYYSTGAGQMDEEAYSVIRAAEGLVRAKITVYRAVEADAPNKINGGDWVTPVRSYAENHAQASITGPSKIIQQNVYSRDLFTNGDSWLEWGYHPQPPVPRLHAGILSLEETITGNLRPENNLFAKLSPKQHGQLLNHEGFVQVMGVEGRYNLGLHDASELLRELRDSAQFDAELESLDDSGFGIHCISPDSIFSFKSCGAEVVTVGDLHLWQQTAADLGQCSVIHKVVASRTPRLANEIILKALPESVALYDLGVAQPDKEAAPSSPAIV